MNDYEITLKTLRIIKGIIPECEETDTSICAEDFRETRKALDKIIRLVETELDTQQDAEAHSEVTIEMELGKEITLKEWARIHGMDESSARQKARRGGFRTAHKKGRDWFISELEINPDGRKRKK